jgi:hypothetical protein
MTAPGEPRFIRGVTIRERPDPWCAAFESALDASGVPVALTHRASWVSRFGSGRSLFLGVADEAGRPTYGCGIDVTPLRSLPGHVVYRVQRFGYALDADGVRVALRALTAYARARRNVVRVVVESFAGDSAAMASTAHVARELGFTPRVPPQRYTRTLRLDLPASPDALLESLPRTARRNLRLAEKSGVRVRRIDDATVAESLAGIERDAFARTGGHAVETDWPAFIAYAREHPELVHIVGLYADADSTRPDLLGFATARAHGDHVEYASAGTVRRPGLKISLGYPLLWDVIAWSQRLGASWFDFGGITGGTAGDTTDTLGGISDFKRHFGGDVLEVGGEWELPIGRMRSAMADVISRVARSVSRAR